MPRVYFDLKAHQHLTLADFLISDNLVVCFKSGTYEINSLFVANVEEHNLFLIADLVSECLVKFCRIQVIALSKGNGSFFLSYILILMIFHLFLMVSALLEIFSVM